MACDTPTLAKYAITHFHATPGEVGAKLGLVTGGVGLVATLFGGWLADFALKFSPRGRIYVSFGAMIAVMPLAYWTFAAAKPIDQFFWTYTLRSFATVMWLPGVAATGQDLVMPRMRGAAAATYNLATSMFGLGLGPFLVGLISDKTEPASQGILTVYWPVAPGVDRRHVHPGEGPAQGQKKPRGWSSARAGAANPSDRPRSMSRKR